MGDKIEKRVAVDGTQRGLARKGSKNKATQLLEDMADDARRLYGIENHHPVRIMNVIGLMAYHGYEAVDENGKAIVDNETKEPVRVPPDHALALSAFGKVAPYIASQLKAVELTGEGGGPVKVNVAQTTRQLAENLGLTIPEDVLLAIEEEEDEE